MLCEGRAEMKLAARRGQEAPRPSLGPGWAISTIPVPVELSGL